MGSIVWAGKSSKRAFFDDYCSQLSLLRTNEPSPQIELRPFCEQMLNLAGDFQRPDYYPSNFNTKIATRSSNGTLKIKWPSLQMEHYNYRNIPINNSLFYLGVWVATPIWPSFSKHPDYFVIHISAKLFSFDQPEICISLRTPKMISNENPDWEDNHLCTDPEQKDDAHNTQHRDELKNVILAYFLAFWTLNAKPYLISRSN